MAARDPEATKQRILDAALREFSEKGIAGARVDAIAKRAGVNKRMIYYYFASKEDLFREILQRRIDEQAHAHDGDLEVSAGAMARRQERLAREADYIRLLAWEALEAPGSSVIDESVRRAHYQRWVEAIEAAQRAGTVPSDLDAAQLALSELLLVLGPMLIPQITTLVTGSSPTSSEQLTQRAAFLNALERHLYG